MDIAAACFLILIGMVASAIGIYQLGPILLGLFMLAGGIWFVSMGLYGLDPRANASPPPAYYPRIRVRWPHGGWLYWNWRTVQWDHLP
jgi:hypothetical protein